MIKLKLALLTAVIAVASGLSACGGGSDGGTTPATSFPLQAAYTAWIAAGTGGFASPFGVDGACKDRGGLTISSAAPTVLHGVSGFSNTQTVALAATDCAPAIAALSGTFFYDSNYIPLGLTTPAGEYAERPSDLVAPAPLPTSVEPGDGALYATLTTYANSTRTIVTGRKLMIYVVDAESPTSVLVTFSAKTFDNLNQLLLTHQARYRLTADGKFVLLSIDVQYSTTSSIHLAYFTLFAP